ncbi:hypothetical protein Btru_000751 [Bulinus truncatus]|nr:hypothetical protein Btru_000751 [Bulinus truncatus]
MLQVDLVKRCKWTWSIATSGHGRTLQVDMVERFKWTWSNAKSGLGPLLQVDMVKRFKWTWSNAISGLGQTLHVDLVVSSIYQNDAEAQKLGNENISDKTINRQMRKRVVPGDQVIKPFFDRDAPWFVNILLEQLFGDLATCV